ncbi:MAG: hypothetical protein HC888_15770 [Candidatus Competibacteraceae bacterium]|nr:hypothetical protein [Candidatus Competibacteraceae bacterium]
MGYTDPNALILAFHGCEKKVGEGILSGAKPHLTASANDYDWLGHGIYFWENNPTRADEWAKGHHRNLKEPFVLGAIIQPGNCLNLMESRSLELLKLMYDKQASAITAAEIPKNTGKMRNLDCAIINMLCASVEGAGTPYDTVRSVFLEGDELYPDSGFKKKTHIQLCVRNEECILGYFRPITGRW